MKDFIFRVGLLVGCCELKRLMTPSRLVDCYLYQSKIVSPFVTVSHSRLVCTKRSCLLQKKYMLQNAEEIEKEKGLRCQ